ncbi:MAG: hypothetical protein WC551_00635 [Patescibacteria group bacterium]
MDQETEKTCRNAYPFDSKSCSKHKQSRTLSRNDKFVFLGINVLVWFIFFAFAAMRRPGDGIGLVIDSSFTALNTAISLYVLMEDYLRPRRLEADIRRFPHGCSPQDDGDIALADPPALKVAARHRCQPEESFARYESIRRSEAKTERTVILAIYGSFALIFAGLAWWVIRDINAEYVPTTWAERVAQSQQTESLMLHVLGYGTLAAVTVTILAICIRAALASRKARVEERKREKALAALARLPTGYRVAAEQEDAEEPLECRLARIQRKIRCPDIDSYLAYVDPSGEAYRSYPTQDCGT